MISIIDYKAGNLRSVKRALDYLGITSRITDRPLEILTSERVIFPGVGAAGSAMDIIKSKGLDIIIHEVVKQGTPFLGICLGAQIILDRSEEDEAPCLGIISGTARKFAESGLKIPHMGWNSFSIQRRHPILEGIDPRAQFYFVHSFYPEPKKQDEVIATTPYGIEFASVIGSENIIAMQFHPEKSGRYGLQILENFCRWDGTEDM